MPYRELREMVEAKFKFLPTSVWSFKTNKLVKSLINDTNTEIRSVKSQDTFSHGVYGYSETDISEFPEELARRIVAFWSEPNDLILDSCMGRATRAMVSLMEGRRYIGVDIDQRAVDNNLKVLNNFREQRAKVGLEVPFFRLEVADGCYLPKLPDKFVDFSFTCPPYWCIEKYSGAKGDLSYCQTYPMFMARIENMVKEVFRVLKHGKFCVWVVGDFRVNGKLYSFSSDLINVFKEAGFLHWDTIINVLNSPYVTRAVRQTASRYYMAKKHDYTLVFYKRTAEDDSSRKIPEGSAELVKREQQTLDWKKFMEPDTTT